MTARFFLVLAGAATACMANAAIAAETPAPRLPVSPGARPVEERYAAADRYLRENISKLVVDNDLRAIFIGDGSRVLFRRGRIGFRELRILDIASGKITAVTTEDLLTKALSQAMGRRVDTNELDLEGVDYDDKARSLSFTALDARWTFGPDGLIRQASDPSARDEGLSPDGRFRVISRGFNLFAVEIATGRELALTTDGSRDMPYGRGIPLLGDILKHGTEDPEMPVSIRWSPDSRRILTWRLDVRDVQRLSITQANPPGSRFPRSFRYIYPTAGAEKLPLARRFLIDVEAAFEHGEARLVHVAIPDEALLYPADPDLAWEGEKPRIQWTERGYGALVIYAVDPGSGAATVTARERMKPLVTVTSSFLMPAPSFGGELNVSERSGWAQLYLVKPGNPDGGRPLTRGAWEVVEVNRIEDDARAVIVTGVGREKDRNPYFRALYRVKLSGAEPQLLTPEPLDHEVTLAGNGRWFIDRMSSPSVPTRTVVRDLADGHIVAVLGEADPSALFATGFTAPEMFRALADDGVTPLYGMIYRPANFDANRRYPVIDNVYTGPTTTQVPVTWEGAIFSGANSVAQIGAVIVNIDGRGTSRRGRTFRLPAYQNLGEVGLDDHIGVIKAMAARYPYLDTTRVGIYGGSAGGYDAARFVLRRPGFFKVAVASSGNHDLRLDKAWWPEVSMGLADEATWERNSNMSVAGNLLGKLLLIHGDIDDNVPVGESLRLSAALIAAGKDVDTVILPNTTHRVSQPFFWRKLRDYFTLNLLGEIPPSQTAAIYRSSNDPVPAAHAAASQ